MMTPRATIIPPRKPEPVTPDYPSDSAEGHDILLVGRDITYVGEIKSCPHLRVEGRVEASLHQARRFDIAAGGRFKGLAHIESAEIAGTFEGTLNVARHLVVKSTGRIRGKVAYGRIEIEPGGEIIGEMSLVGTTAPAGAASDLDKMDPPGVEYLQPMKA
jgi:cytoskeletal protein CcmA (bactofilin family)